MWGVAQKGYFRTDLEAGTLKAGGKVILQAKVVAGKLVVEWTNPEWGPWKELVESKEFLELQTNMKTRLENATGQMSKGVDKGAGKGVSK